MRSHGIIKKKLNNKSNERRKSNEKKKSIKWKKRNKNTKMKKKKKRQRNREQLQRCLHFAQWLMISRNIFNYSIGITNLLTSHSRHKTLPNQSIQKKISLFLFRLHWIEAFSSHECISPTEIVWNVVDIFCNFKWRMKKKKRSDWRFEDCVASLRMHLINWKYFMEYFHRCLKIIFFFFIRQKIDREMSVKKMLFFVLCLKQVVID